MILRELISRVNSLYKEDIPEYNKLYSNRHIYNKLCSVRSRLLTQKKDRHNTIGKWSYQTINLPLVLVDSDNTIFTTQILKSSIPEIIIAKNEYLIQNCSNINKTINFPYIDVEAIPYLKGSKYTKDNIHYTISNNNLYIINSTTLESVDLTAIFSDPLSIPSNSSYLNREFPIDNDLIDSLIQLTMEELYVKSKE